MNEPDTVAEFEARYLRDVLGNFPTSVVAVTTTMGDEPVGMVVGSFTSVSLDPPLVSFLVDRSSSTLPRILEAGRFCANALASDQEWLCRQMSKKGAARFEGVAWEMSRHQNPILEGVVAWVDCAIDKTVELGDHFLVVGRIGDLNVASVKRPLLFFRGGYGDYTSTAQLLLDSHLGR
ncbi:flavin reductase family protein [Gordonia sp. ABSL1-1]|uniref:flavin reductase family protein n=1 Tax=Gordonia sp. ABSL1-1 TaxID=3053923 RepID=UPI0025722686|nr:flavin reductase family protein [Gordonia sp. ABSL1-1]MDL9938095.1 flavin reductase family protein [Gordonia sp. ABSL1-1]